LRAHSAGQNSSERNCDGSTAPLSVSSVSLWQGSESHPVVPGRRQIFLFFKTEFRLRAAQGWDCRSSIPGKTPDFLPYVLPFTLVCVITVKSDRL
jgi:hypothetical protein